MFGDDPYREQEMSGTARIVVSVIAGLGAVAISLAVTADGSEIGARLAFAGGMGAATTAVVYLATYVPVGFGCLVDILDLLACVAEFLLAIFL